MRSTVYDRFKRTGLMTGAERPVVEKAKVAASSVAEQTGLPAAAAIPPTPRAPEIPTEAYPPNSDDEPAPTDAAEEEHHGTPENPVDFVNGKLIIRTDSGELFELKQFNSPASTPKANGFPS
jgi:hypothetical protein